MLLRGPPNNVIPLYPIVERIPNSGSYSWTPSTALTPDTTGYAIQLIVDSNGQYQYSNQFGISARAGDSSMSTSTPISSTPTTMMMMMTMTPAAATGSATPVPAGTQSPSAPANSMAHLTVAGARNGTGTGTGTFTNHSMVVMTYSTYCPSPTSFVVNNRTYSVDTVRPLSPVPPIPRILHNLTRPITNQPPCSPRPSQ